MDQLEAMNKHISAVKATYILLKNLTVFKESRKLAIEKRDSLSLRDRMQLDNRLIQNITQKLETKVEMIKHQLGEKESEIRRLEEQLKHNTNKSNTNRNNSNNNHDPDLLVSLLESKQAQFAQLKKATQDELESMRSEYEQQLARREADRRNEIEHLKMSNTVAIKQKEEAMQRLDRKSVV